MERVCRGVVPRDLDFAAADAATIRAIRRERSLLLSATAVDLESYERVSLEKQSVGWLASAALARAAGCDERRRRAIGATLKSVALALQTYDDVVDWEDDLERTGSWTVCLLRSISPATMARDPRGETARARAVVLKSGVLLTMLERAAQHMRSARRRATALRADRLAAWAASREARFEALAAAEKRSAGYAVRAHALAAWAGEVLT
jgi:hypothetical protein